MAYECYLCKGVIKSRHRIRHGGKSRVVCEICWSEANCHRVGDDLEGRIEAISEFEGSQILWYMCRGHVSKAEFCHEMVAEYGIKAYPENVEHSYVRAVPYGDSMCLCRSEPGQGAFKATMLDISGVR